MLASFVREAERRYRAFVKAGRLVGDALGDIAQEIASMAHQDGIKKYEFEVSKPKADIPGIVAFVNIKITLDIGTLVVKDYAVRRGNDGGLWVAAPGKMGKDKKFYDSVHMLSKEGRSALHELILAAVKAKGMGAEPPKPAPEPEEGSGFS